jgi:DNA-binding transcriptional ArsR family regulator
LLFRCFAKHWNIRYGAEMAGVKNHRALERIIKGFGNHRRIQILELLGRQPELSVEDVAEKLSIGYQNASDHLRKLAIAGLVAKRNDGPSVRHKLTRRGEIVLVFCKTLE